MLLEHSIEKNLAVLICDKNPFIESMENISQWLNDAQLKHLVTNDIYGNYEIVLPERFNCNFYNFYLKILRYKNYVDLSGYK